MPDLQDKPTGWAYDHMADCPVTVTPDDAITKLRLLALGENCDPERDHQTGDAVLLAVLRHLGHGKVADAWESAANGWWWA